VRLAGYEQVLLFPAELTFFCEHVFYLCAAMGIVFFRWHNHLSPAVNKEEWTEEEDQLIMKLVQEMGTKWSKIVKMLPGRTDNAIKNRWNSTMRKNLRRQLKEGGKVVDSNVSALMAQYDVDNLPVRKRGSATTAAVATAAAAAAVTAAAVAASSSPRGGRSGRSGSPQSAHSGELSPKSLIKRKRQNMKPPLGAADYDQEEQHKTPEMRRMQQQQNEQHESDSSSSPLSQRFSGHYIPPGSSPLRPRLSQHQQPMGAQPHMMPSTGFHEQPAGQCSPNVAKPWWQTLRGVDAFGETAGHLQQCAGDPQYNRADQRQQDEQPAQHMPHMPHMQQMQQQAFLQHQHQHLARQRQQFVQQPPSQPMLRIHHGSPAFIKPQIRRGTSEPNTPSGLRRESEPHGFASVPPQHMHPHNMHAQQMHPSQLHPQQLHPQQMHPQQMHPQQMHPQQMRPQCNAQAFQSHPQLLGAMPSQQRILRFKSGSSEDGEQGAACSPRLSSAPYDDSLASLNAHFGPLRLGNDAAEAAQCGFDNDFELDQYIAGVETQAAFDGSDATAYDQQWRVQQQQQQPPHNCCTGDCRPPHEQHAAEFHASTKHESACGSHQAQVQRRVHQPVHAYAPTPTDLRPQAHQAQVHEPSWQPDTYQQAPPNFEHQSELPMEEPNLGAEWGQRFESFNEEEGGFGSQMLLPVGEMIYHGTN